MNDDASRPKTVVLEPADRDPNDYVFSNKTNRIDETVVSITPQVLQRLADLAT